MSGFKLVEKEKLPDVGLITCLNCQHAMPVFTHAQAINVVCANCSRIFEIRPEDSGLERKKLLENEKVIPYLPIGSKGRIQEVQYVVVGFLVYREKNFDYRWREYVLFNPLHGYAFLSEYDGHWNFFRFISDYSTGTVHNHNMCYYHNKEYKIFNKYQSKVLYAQGEFFWKVLEDNSTYREYIAPPYMLVHAVNSTEQTWMQGELIEPEEVQAAFGIADYPPQQIDVGPTELFSKNFSFEFVMLMAGVAAALLLLIQVILFASCDKKTVLNQTYYVADEIWKSSLTPIPGPTIDLTTWTGSTNLEIKLKAPVTNSWFGTGISLMNIKTGHEYAVELGVEEYHGYEDGEKWREGGTRTETMLSSLPSGTYQMLIQPFRDTTGQPITTFDLQVVQDVPIWSNFWISLLLLAILPIIQWFRKNSFERSRWMSSDYSPYNTEE